LWIAHTILLGAYSVDSRGNFIRSLIAREPRITARPFSLTYTIDPRARWSDGVPVSARDFVFTWRVELDLNVDLDRATAAEYARIVRAHIIGPKRVTFVFDKPYSGWKGLFESVLPWHALRGQDLSTVWRDAIDDPRTGTPISDGPFLSRTGATATGSRSFATITIGAGRPTSANSSFASYRTPPHSWQRFGLSRWT
jgi:ABC-type transport system substrate-binding protein